MKPRRLDWVKFPTHWIEAKGLKSMKWSAGVGSANVAALLAYITLSHLLESDVEVLGQRPADEWGRVRITYDALTTATSISRTKLSQGLQVLESLALIKRVAGSQSSYDICGYDPFQNWAKLPCRFLYKGDVITAFSDFQLRKPIELHALKMYLLLVSRRDRATNLVNISYDTIMTYTGIPRQNIRQAINVLLYAGLVHIEKVRSWDHDGIANAYRVAHVDSYLHPGTTFGAQPGMPFVDQG
jgi:DNA-binding transcriptional ArsR family regulator